MQETLIVNLQETLIVKGIAFIIRTAVKTNEGQTFLRGLGQTIKETVPGDEIEPEVIAGVKLILEGMEDQLSA